MNKANTGDGIPFDFRPKIMGTIHGSGAGNGYGMFGCGGGGNKDGYGSGLQGYESGYGKGNGEPPPITKD